MGNSRVCFLLTEYIISRGVSTLLRLGLAIVPLCRGTGAPLRRTQAPWPLRNFLTCALWRKILLSLWPLAYTRGRDEIASLSDWLQLLICLHKAPIKTRCIRSFIKPSTLCREEGGSSLALSPTTYIHCCECIENDI